MSNLLERDLNYLLKHLFDDVINFTEYYLKINNKQSLSKYFHKAIIEVKELWETDKDYKKELLQYYIRLGY